MVYEILRKDAVGRDMRVGQKICIGGKEVKLRFTMPIWREMEEKICLLDDVYSVMHSKERLHRENIPALAELLSGGVITADEIMKEEDPATIHALMDEIGITISKSVTMKEKKYEDDSVHDETLEEIEKKDPRAD